LPYPTRRSSDLRPRFLIAENVRVPADHLFGDAVHDIRERKSLLLLRHARMIDDLQQQIAELFLEIGPVAALDGIGDLVRFLDRVRRDALESLFEIPRAARSRRPERCHYSNEIGNGAARTGLVVRSHYPFLIAR